MATVTKLSYEEVAEMFGVPLDSNGIPALSDTELDGLDLSMLTFPLLKRGWGSVVLCTTGKVDPGNRVKLPTSNEIKELLPNRLAVIGYIDSEIGPHALAWDGQCAIDCDNRTEATSLSKPSALTSRLGPSSSAQHSSRDPLAS